MVLDLRFKGIYLNWIIGKSSEQSLKLNIKLHKNVDSKS